MQLGPLAIRCESRYQPVTLRSMARHQASVLLALLGRWLCRHDEAQQRIIIEKVQMPDRLSQNIIVFIRQNDGKPQTKRREEEFAALTD
jgi:hypothetical protein